MKDLRSGIEHLKQAKAHMSKANGIMSDYVSKLKELEEENARLKTDYETALEHEDRLKAELDDWKGNAEGFQPDVCMRLPLDADGEPIRFGDVVWYVGSDTEIEKDCPLKVAGFVTIFGAQKIYIETREYPDRAIDPESLTHKQPEQPEQPEPADSWEKLEEDIKKKPCSYFDIDQDTASCDDCPHGSSRTGTVCWLNALSDMIARAKKLAGIEEEAER